MAQPCLPRAATDSFVMTAVITAEKMGLLTGLLLDLLLLHTLRLPDGSGVSLVLSTLASEETLRWRCLFTRGAGDHTEKPCQRGYWLDHWLGSLSHFSSASIKARAWSALEMLNFDFC